MPQEHHVTKKGFILFASSFVNCTKKIFLFCHLNIFTHPILNDKR